LIAITLVGGGNRTLKSFRVYLKEPTVAPERYVEQMPAQERQGLREAFVPAARRFRRTVRVAGFFIAGGFICVVLGFVLPKQMSGCAIGGFFICWLAVASVIVLSPALRCPACRNELQRGFGSYCPECGSRSLDAAGWFRTPHCSACGRDMRRGKTRRYRIRACTHCGAWLDDKGL